MTYLSNPPPPQAKRVRFYFVLFVFRHHNELNASRLKRMCISLRRGHLLLFGKTHASHRCRGGYANGDRVFTTLGFRSISPRFLRHNDVPALFHRNRLTWDDVLSVGTKKKEEHRTIGIFFKLIMFTGVHTI